jgi:hypothetical protein
MTPVPLSSEVDMCPCLVPVVNDRLFIVNTGVYCRRPDGRVRVPTRRTLLDVCMTRSYQDCAGYRASSALPQDA